MQLFKRTPQEAFHNIENFDYKVHYISNLLSSSSEYKDFRIAYVDENTHSKMALCYLYMVILHGVTYGDI